MLSIFVLHKGLYGIDLFLSLKAQRSTFVKLSVSEEYFSVT